MFFHDEIKTRSYFLTHGVNTYMFIDFSWNTRLKSCDLTVQGLPQHTDILPPWTLLLWCLYPLSDTTSPWPSLCLRVCASLKWITYWTPIDTYLDFFFIDKLSYFFIYKATSEHHKWKEPSFIWCCRIAILKGIHHVLSCSILISLLLYFLIYTYFFIIVLFICTYFFMSILVHLYLFLYYTSSVLKAKIQIPSLFIPF